MEVAADTNLTAAALQRLHIPTGVTRILFKTLNSRRYGVCVCLCVCMYVCELVQCV